MIFSYNSGRKILSIIWFHDISKPKVTADDSLNLQFIKDLVGPTMRPHTTLFTTNWDREPLPEPFSRGGFGQSSLRMASQAFKTRENELLHRPEFAGIVDDGRNVKRHGQVGQTRGPSKDEALALVEEALSKPCSPETVLLIQDELCRAGRPLKETTVGKALDSRIEAALEESARAEEELDEEWQDASGLRTQEILQDMGRLREERVQWKFWSSS